MHVRFDPTFDRGAWPDQLAGAPAAAGRVNAGPLGLLDILETALGLGGLRQSEAERTAALLPNLRARGYWSASATSDPFGTARRLLRQRDDLMLEGWSGEPVSERLESLARVTQVAPPGLPDRLAAVNHALAQPRGARAAQTITRLTVLGPDQDTPLRWQTTFERLEACGTLVERRALAPSPAGESDLGTVQRLLIEKGAGASVGLSGDGTLGLLRPGGVLEAAESTAAWLAAVRRRAPEASIVVVNSDPVLDDALTRHGMPASGAAASSPQPLLAILPLTLALLWYPRDAASARELLQVPGGPVPFSVALSLVAALDSWPAVGSPTWEWRLAKALAAREDASQVASVLAVLFGPESVAGPREVGGVIARPAAVGGAPSDAGAGAPMPHGSTCPPEPLWALLDGLDRWAATSTQSGGAAAEGVWAQVGRQLASFRLLAGSALDFSEAGRSDPGWRAPDLMRLADAATADARLGAAVGPRRPAQAGLTVVRDPGSVAGAVDFVAWWDFTEAAEGKAGEIPLSEAERAGLEKLGVRPPDFGARAVARAARYARPLIFAREAILLVAPTATADGEEAHPHPFWDECVVRIDPASVARISQEVPQLPRPRHKGGRPGQMSLWAPSPARHNRGLSPPPPPRRGWVVPAGVIEPRPIESPSGLELLLGCQFSWVMKYVGRVSTGLVEASPPPNLFRGKVAHEVLSEVITSHAVWSGSGGTLASRAGVEALSLFDQKADRLWAHLGMPGAEADRAELRRMVEEAARWLAGSFEEGGYTTVVPETTLEAPLGAGMLKGRPDLVLGPAPAVLDLKLGSAGRRRKQLENGTAVQLAAYAWLVLRNGSAAELPPVGYFILSASRLYTTAQGAFPRATVLAGPAPADTWAASTAGRDEALAQLLGGRVEAQGVASEDAQVVTRAELSGDRIALEPPCRFCEFGALCGRSFGLLEERDDGDD